MGRSWKEGKCPQPGGNRRVSHGRISVHSQGRHECRSWEDKCPQPGGDTMVSHGRISIHSQGKTGG